LQLTVVKFQMFCKGWLTFFT